MKHFQCSDKNIYVQAMKNKLSNLGDFVYKLNAFIFVFKTGIEQYKMNGIFIQLIQIFTSFYILKFRTILNSK